MEVDEEVDEEEDEDEEEVLTVSTCPPPSGRWTVAPSESNQTLRPPPSLSRQTRP